MKTWTGLEDVERTGMVSPWDSVTGVPCFDFLHLAYVVLKIPPPADEVLERAVEGGNERIFWSCEDRGWWNKSKVEMR